MRPRLFPTIKGSASDVRKAKSLVGRWLERPNTSETSGKTDNDSVEIVIEGDTVVSAHVKVGRGRMWWRAVD